MTPKLFINKEEISCFLYYRYFIDINLVRLKCRRGNSRFTLQNI